MMNRMILSVIDNAPAIWRPSHNAAATALAVPIILWATPRFVASSIADVTRTKDRAQSFGPIPISARRKTSTTVDVSLDENAIGDQVGQDVERDEPTKRDCTGPHRFNDLQTAFCSCEPRESATSPGAGFQRGVHRHLREKWSC